MATITLEVSDELATRWEQIPPKQRDSLFASFIEGYEEEDEDTLLPPSEEDLLSVKRGLADSEAGRTYSAAQVFAELREQVGL